MTLAVAVKALVGELFFLVAAFEGDDFEVAHSGEEVGWETWKRFRGAWEDIPPLSLGNDVRLWYGGDI